MVSMKNQVARYYTICQTFHSKIYQQYLDAFDNVLTGKEFKRKFETIEQISNESTSSIELFMKFYHQSKTGITKQISKAVEEDRFVVSGVFEKGINFEKDRIVGTNLIVVGGTGVLPFIDLFAYLGRRLLYEKAQSRQVFLRELFDDYMSEAKFVVYAYYPADKENSVGVDFCEKVSDLFLHFGLKDKFKFIPQYTRSGDKKISTKFDILNLIKEVFNDTLISSISVWGSPPMNNLFQGMIGKICNNFKISQNQIEIL